jgi:hypothetical protein
MGLIETTKGALTPQQKVLAANALIFKQTADAQGDFARTSEGVANQQRILEATFKDLQTEVGQKLLPTFNSALKSLNQILENLDADTVMSFAKAAAAAALAFGGWKLGPLVSMLPQVAKGIMTMNAATLSLNKTLKTNLFTAAFAFALPYIIDFIDGVDEAGEEVDQLSERQEELKSVTERLVEAETEQLGVANNYFSALSKTNPKSQERKELIDEINKRYGTTLKNLSDEVAFQNQLKEAQDKVIEGIKAKIALQIQEEKYTTLLKQRAKFAGQATQEEAKLNALEKKFLEERGMTVAQYNQSLVDQRINELALSETEREKAEQTRRVITTGDDLLVQIEKQAKAYDVAQNEVTKIDSEINNLDADTKSLVNSMSSLTTTTNDNTNGNGKAKTAIELVTEEISKLNTEAELLAFKGDWIGAKKKTEQANLLQNQLNGLKKTIEEFNSEVNIQRPEILPMEPADTGTDTSLPELPIPDAMSIKVKLDVDEESAENAVVSIQAIHEAASNVAGGLSTLESNFGQMVGAFAALSGENAEYVKALAVIQVQIQMASAIAAAIAGATSSAATTGPGAPFVLAGYIASMVGAVVGAFAQTTQLLSAEVPKPGFYDGTAYLQRGGNPKGKDTIPVMAHEGEAIIPTRNNLQYPGLAKSWIDGNLDGYINNNFVRPALMEQQRQAEEDFADRLASSMALQMSSNFDDYRLYRAIKEQTAVNRTGFETMKINRKKIRGGR